MIRQLPILYSFRRCPYAMRARLAIANVGVQIELREIQLKNKPAAMLACSPKGTVPVLVLPSGDIIDESVDIMVWAFAQAVKTTQAHFNPSVKYPEDLKPLIRTWVAQNDNEFKPWLDKYKYADRYPEYATEYYRAQGEVFLAKLENLLAINAYLLADYPTFADIAIMPFIRQFAMVDKVWFDASGYPRLKHWLADHLESELFLTIMQKYSPWKEGDAAVTFPSV